MNILSNLTTDETIANEKDSIGGGSRTIDSGIYEATIVHAYVTKSAGGAVGMVVNMKTDAGQELRQTFWMTSGTAKGCKNYYEDKNGDKQYLPGFILANSLCLLTVGQEISALETEQKVIPLYNVEAKSEIPTKVDMLMDLVGKQVVAAVMKQIVDKTKKNETSGLYEPTGETREENEIDKFFRQRDRMTTAEIRAKAEAATFVNTWAEKWTGKVRDKSKGAAGGVKAISGLPGTKAVAANKPSVSLFA
jgi:hypothetical protein